MTTISWHILTGEYPPQPGGVSDYTALLAQGLVDAGAKVTVWTSGREGASAASPGVMVQRVAGSWSSADLIRLNEQLKRFPAPRRLLVQYAPNAWGYKGLNFMFCRWVSHRRIAGDVIYLMIHEPFYPWRLRDKPVRWILAAGQRWMIRTLLAASSHIYLSIPAWEPMLRPYDPREPRPMTWMPICNTIPITDDPSAVKALRKRLAPDAAQIIGTFGTYGDLIRPMLSEVLPVLLQNPDRVALLLGRGGDTVALKLIKANPELKGRVIAPGARPSQEVSLYLQSCDLLIQPYPDGVSSRRTSVMAGLAHKLPIVTTHGFLSEPMWQESGCVVLTPASDPSRLAQAADALLADPEMRAELGRLAGEVYTAHFSLERIIETLSDGLRETTIWQAPPTP